MNQKLFCLVWFCFVSMNEICSEPFEAKCFDQLRTNMAAQLFAMDSFPVPLKTKAIYFVKIAKVVVPKDNPSSVLIIGDMASKPIEQLATIVDDYVIIVLFTRFVSYMVPIFCTRGTATEYFYTYSVAKVKKQNCFRGLRVTCFEKNNTM
ncbi:hypothetical protein QTP88_006905 [Uroleucon formosanum]